MAELTLCPHCTETLNEDRLFVMLTTFSTGENTLGKEEKLQLSCDLFTVFSEIIITIIIYW